MQQLLAKIAAKLERISAEIEAEKLQEKNYRAAGNWSMVKFQIDWRIGLEEEYNRIFKIYSDLENAK